MPPPFKKQFKNIYGLALTFLFSAYRGVTDQPALQIVHTRGVAIRLLPPAMDQAQKILCMIHCLVMSALIQSS